MAYATVADACAAFHDGRLTEDGLTAVLVAFPPLKAAPLPDAVWYDAIIRNRGPIFDLQGALREGLIGGPVYGRVVNAMMDAGHSA